MQGWIEGFQASIDFIEDNLTENLDIEEIAAKAALSPFYYQRIFGALCGLTVGEYIRARRMTLAAQELAGGEIKVIDAAMKYGYDSPDSFAKAFQRFHGVTPSMAREPGAPLRSFARMHIKISLEGGGMLDYRIVEKAPFTIVGFKRRFNSDTSYQEIPKFWNEWTKDMRGIKGIFACAWIWTAKILITGSLTTTSPGRMCRRAATPASSPAGCGRSSSARARCRTVCKA